MRKISATVIADSLNPDGTRLTSFVLVFPRFILSELNTHRAFSRNSASSRAIPFEKMLSSVKEDPFVPIAFQKDHKGMQGVEYFTGAEHNQCVQDWLLARDAAANATINFTFPVTKQLRNRILEPFLWHTAIVTGTDFENFFALRAHKDAEIHIAKLANVMLEAYNSSVPKKLKMCEWHVPFGDLFDPKRLAVLEGDEMENKIKIATARCARVSYLNFEGKDDYDADFSLYDRLMNDGHCFDGETEILTKLGWKKISSVKGSDYIAEVSLQSGKFIGFSKPLRIIEQKFKGKMYHYDNFNIDLFITDGHKIVFRPITKSSHRKNLGFENSVVAAANSPSSINSKKKTVGEQEMVMYSSTEKPEVNLSKIYWEGVLDGMFVGDGSLRVKKLSPNTARFRFKRQRKVDFLTSVLKELNITAKIYESKGVTDIEVSRDYANWVDENGKTIPYDISDHPEYLVGLFDGLKNSDGSIKRKTWVYSTTSDMVKNRIKELAPLIGLTVSSVSERAGNERHAATYRLYFSTNNIIRLNDSRTSGSQVQIKDYNGDVFCVEVPSGGIIVRRNEKTVVTHNCSPFEHCAQVVDFKGGGNFSGNWLQLRKTFSGENKQDRRVIRYG